MLESLSADQQLMISRVRGPVPSPSSRSPLPFPLLVTALSTRKTTIHWIAIYPVDSTIQRSNISKVTSCIFSGFPTILVPIILQTPVGSS